MKKYLVLILAAALTLSACSLAETTEQPATEQPQAAIPESLPTATQPAVAPASFESQTYVSQLDGFMLDFPVTWVARETLIGERGSQIVFVSSPELIEAPEMPAGQSRVFVNIYPWDPKNDLPAYVQKTKDSWAGSGFTIQGEQAVTLDSGMSAVLLTVQTPTVSIPLLITTLGERYLVMSGEGDLNLVNAIFLRLRPFAQ